jgi:imidazole glycerol-phosphate synthase subunit HisH
MNNILIIDYSINNTRSIFNSVKKVGFDPFVSSSPKDLTRASKIILPGVGSFDVAMKILIENGWKEELLSYRDKYGVPLLGICLGMQLFSNKSSEGTGSSGLGLIKGNVSKIIPSNAEKIPHVGWNSVSQIRPSPLFDNIPDNCDFYFVHSYKFDVGNESNAIGSTPFSGSFTSVINDSNAYGVQFHPEKSSKYGLKLLENFLRIN